MEANSTGGQGSRRAVAPSDDDDDDDDDVAQIILLVILLMHEIHPRHCNLVIVVCHPGFVKPPRR